MNNQSFRRIHAIILRHLYVWYKNLARLTDSFWWPLVNLFIWGYVSVYLQGKSSSVQLAVSFLAGFMFWNIIQRGQEEISLGLLEDLWNRNFINIFASPISIWEYLIAVIITGIMKLMIIVSFMTVVAFFLFQFNFLSFGILLLPFIFSLLLTAWWMGFLINGLIIRFGYDVEALGWTLVFLLQPFSGVYYPTSILPSWMQIISWVLPSSYIFTGMRNVIFNNFFDWNLFWLSLLLNISYVILSLIFYKKMYDSAKDKGYLVKLF